jgi:hypothetical protein
VCGGFVCTLLCVFGLFGLYSVWWDCLHFTVCGEFTWTVPYVLELFGLYCLLGLFALYCVLWVSLDYTVCVGFIWTVLCVVV